MNKVFRKLAVLVMVFSLVFSSVIPAAAATKSKTITLKNKTKTVCATVTAGDKLKLTVKDGKKTIKISKVSLKSSKKAVAAVSKKGVITAKKAGKATITVKYKKKTVKLKVTVKKKSATKTKTIKLKKKTSTVSAKMTVGNKLKLTVKDGNKTVKASKVSFKSSKKSVAAVSKKGIITAKKAGKATITIKANKKTVKLKVTVKKKSSSSSSSSSSGSSSSDGKKSDSSSSDSKKSDSSSSGSSSSGSSSSGSKTQDDIFDDSTPAASEPERKSITQPFMSTFNNKQRKITFKWSVEDLDYKASNDKPNKYLTVAALTLATNIETTLPGTKQWDLVYDTLDKMGFTKNKYHAYFDGDEKSQKINCPAMVFATHKNKVNGKNVVVAVFRGSSSAQDFVTDVKSQISLNLLTILASVEDISKLEALLEKYVNPDSGSSKNILGFYEVGVNATNELKAYMKANGLTKSNTTVFITGHSLGAATASLVGLRTAADLVNPSSVFCYPFATPNYFKGKEQSLESKRMTGKGMKMFSFDNEEDIVPDVPLGLSYYKTLNRINFDREWIEAAEPTRYKLFDEIYTYFRGRSYEADTGNYMPKEYSFKLFSDLGVSVDSIMVRNHMPYTYMALILSELPAKEARKYIGN